MSQAITEQQVRHVALLSRLELSEQEVERFTADLANVLAYFEKLSELELDGIEPMAHAIELTNVLRDDREQPGMPVEAALANAPEQDPPFFKVVKVLGDGDSA